MRPVLSKASRIARLLRPRNTKVDINSISSAPNSLVFRRHTPWWARWTLGLIACDIFMTGSAIDLTYNHWTTLSSNLENPEINQIAKDPIIPDVYILRPSWQRLGLCTAHMVFGAGIAAALLVTQMRFVRTAVIFSKPGLTKGRSVFLQCAHNFKGNGLVLPLSKCSIGKGRNDTEVILRANGEIGHWYIGFVESDINGHRHAAIQARAEFMAAWEDKPVEAFLPRNKSKVDDRWKSGPLRRVARH